MNKEERKKYMKEYREKNKERIKEKRKEWEKTHNRNEYKRIWRKKNKEHCKEYQKYRSVAHIKQLEQENKQLNERIGKAIEYIEKHKYKYWNGLGEIGIEDREFEKDTNPEDLLEILEGENNEN